MNATQLLAHFDRLAEAPYAVPRLRRFILDLAVRGKLVEQDSRDESAAALLKRIDKEKSRLVDLGEVRQERARVPIDPEEMTFKLPLGWEWTRFGGYANDISTGPFGSALHQSDYVFNGIPLVNPSHMQNGRIVPDPKVTVSEETATSLAVYRMRVGDIVMARRGEVGRAAAVTERESGWLCGTGSFYLRFAADVSRDYVILLLRCDSVRRYLAGEAVGTTMVNLNHAILNRMPLAIPPLAEQHRIVAKVDELMALCDQLEAAQQERERRRDHLAAASLQRLNQPTEVNPAADQTEPAEARQQAQREQQKDHARFHLQNLDRIVTRPEQIKAMRQTILTLAIRGMLVSPTHADVSVVGASNGTKKLQPWAFELPESWRWQKVESFSELVTDGEHATPERIVSHEVPLVTAKNVRDGTMDYSVTDWVARDTAEKAWKRCRPLFGDLLLVCVGATTGRLCVLREPKDMVLVRSVALIRPSPNIDADYLAIAIRSPLGQNQIWSSVKVTAQPCLYINRINALAFPVPPLAEQHRIVAKVDELMALCDQLEAQLTRSQTDSRRLLEAVLDAALAPA